MSAMDQAQLLNWTSQLLAAVPQQNRPKTTLTWAQSINGNLCTAEKTALPLSCPESMLFTHCLRQHHDAILVGIGTVLQDNPSLSTRYLEGINLKHPRPIIIDPKCQTPPESRFISTDRSPIILCEKGCKNFENRKILEGNGCQVVEVDLDEDQRLSLPAILERLANLGIKSLMIEGGISVIEGFLLQPELIDRIIITVAPVFYEGLGINISCPLDPIETRVLGRDTVLVAVHSPRNT